MQVCHADRKEICMKSIKWERIFWGLFLIAAAVVLVVSKLGLFHGVSFWGVMITAVLAVCLVKSIIDFSITGILFSIAFLCIVYAEPLGITAITPWTVLGAALLGSIGFNVLFHHKKQYYHHRHDQNFNSYETIQQDDVNMNTSFSSSVKYINSTDFKRASVDCSFGAMKVYLDKAVIQNGSAELKIDASFAGIELYVPRDWKVENRLRVTLAGVDEKNCSMGNGSTRLILTGTISFTGVTILYV